MVPFLSSIGPVLSNCTGPTRLGLVVEGGGAKYERFTVVPTEAGAGNRLQPGPGPIGPGPGPCAVLGFEIEVASVITPSRDLGSIVLDATRRGLRIRCTSCADIIVPNARAIAGASAQREDTRILIPM